ncbi:MAG: DinB family protein [Terriglobales bacterium]
MAIAQYLLAEFEAQAPVTRRFLERLPEDKLTWKPHPKSMSAGQLALHLARVPGAVVQSAQQDSVPPNDFGNIPQPASVRQVLTTFDESVATVKNVLPRLDDARMHGTWRVVQDGQEIFAMPRGEFLRNIMLNHWYQHRGQFAVYLRLLNVAVPASWGPSADELPPFTQKAQKA